jgi:hypothetical protein
MRRTVWLVAGATLVVAAAVTLNVARHHQPSVAFASPADGATVSSPVFIKMEARGITVEPVGPIHKNAGHFHVMVDIPCFKPGAFVEVHTVGFEHFGDGRTTAELDLPPGKHTLCLQVGDGAHVTLRPTAEITITVARR